MAYTSIIPVHRLDNSIRYIQNKEKTTLSEDDAGSLKGALSYAMNSEKTEASIYEDSIGCTCIHAYEDMVCTKERFHKMGGVQGYHLVQSFAEGEISPELAHLIGQELAEQLLKGNYEVVITTHLNTSHYHNHLVFNSVSMEDGKKYHSNQRSYYEEVRKLSDGLCRKYGLSVIEPTDGKAMSYSEWKAEQEGKATWRTGIRMDIRDTVADSFTWNQFLGGMEQKGYEWKLNRKYIALRAPGMERYVRLRSLGKKYSEHGIREWILQPKTVKRTPTGKESERKSKKLHGLQALYYSYLYQMGVLKQKPKRTYYQVREEIRKLDARIMQMEYLQKNGITTREELKAHQRPLEAQILKLVKERRGLYRIQPRPERISEIASELKPLRKELKMCIQIGIQSEEMEKRLKEAMQMEMNQQIGETTSVDVAQQQKEELEKRQKPERG